MTAFNAVRCRVKPGREQEFLDAHAKVQRNGQAFYMPTLSRRGSAPSASSPNRPTWTRSQTRGRT